MQHNTYVKYRIHVTQCICVIQCIWNTYVYYSVYAIMYDIYTVLHLGTLRHSAWNTVHCVSLSVQIPRAQAMQRSVDYFEHHEHIHRHCSALQHTAAHCNTQHFLDIFEHDQHTPWHCSIMQHTSKHTATHCNTECSVHNLDMKMRTSTHPSDNLHLDLNDSLAIPFITRVYAIRTCVMQQSIFSTVDDTHTHFRRFLCFFQILSSRRWSHTFHLHHFQILIWIYSDLTGVEMRILSSSTCSPFCALPPSTILTIFQNQYRFNPRLWCVQRERQSQKQIHKHSRLTDRESDWLRHTLEQAQA